jgi:hypothetical protein
MNVAVFLDVSLSSLVDADRRFRGFVALMMETLSVSETPVTVTGHQCITYQKTAIFVCYLN